MSMDLVAEAVTRGLVASHLKSARNHFELAAGQLQKANDLAFSTEIKEHIAIAAFHAGIAIGAISDEVKPKQSPVIPI